MNDPPTTGHFATGNQLLAVQQDTAAILVDWQLFHDWDPRDGTFHGAIFIIAADGHQTHSLPWSAPTDIAADTALGLAGWVRTDNWVRDDSGRRVARVIVVAAETSQTVLPGQRTPTYDAGHAGPAIPHPAHSPR